jgi:hypothetical protein
MNTQYRNVISSYNQQFDISMKDRKEVRQINRATRFPNQPKGYDDIMTKRDNGYQLSIEEETIHRSHIINCGRSDSFIAELVLQKLHEGGVIPVLSWNEQYHDVDNELSKFFGYRGQSVNTLDNVRYEPYPTMTLFPNDCRINSMKVCLSSGGRYRYMEGVVLHNGFHSLMTHSWNVDSEGKYYDFTLHNSVCGHNPFDSGCSLYFGIEIPIDIVQRVWDLTHRTPPIIPFLNITPKVEKTLGQRNG